MIIIWQGCSTKATRRLLYYEFEETYGDTGWEGQCLLQTPALKANHCILNVCL